jgi:DNA-binding NarL/FixJ family response regulator
MTRLADPHGDHEEYLSRLYLAMIRLGTPTQEALGQEGFQPEDVGRAAGELAARGLIEPAGPGRWEVQPPELALPRMAAKLENRARLSRSVAPELGVIWRQTRPRVGDADPAVGGIEPLLAPEDCASAMRSMEGLARTELRMLLADSPAARLWLAEAASDEAAPTRTARQVDMVVDRNLLGDPAVPCELERQAAAGARVRVMGAVPFGVVTADDRAAVVDLTLHDDAGGGGFVVRRAAMVAGMNALVNVGSTRGVRLRPRTEDSGEDLGMPADERDRRILGLLAAGATDQMIARSVGISTRTVERRIRSLMEHLDSATRFQAGVQAARRGWF